ncbi:hypothetical protein DYB32_008883 [Aphanomyces invadans]|uniref:Dienelactone hydrolase domain-containing protein n=1 Tax=Aphanomyces invadans TaxID=157072 RepID=A0A3R6VU92_9STRA|nr:hypothetical protein DYB32_008883 [Aphanomyces invadans]
MSCCPPTSLPPMPTTSAKESMLMGTTNVFFYDNPASDRCVLVFPDVFGVDSGRTKDNCIRLSALYKVVLIEMNAANDFPLAEQDTPWPWPVEWIRKLVLQVRIIKWARARPFDKLQPKIDHVVTYMKTHHNVAKFGAMGYCWGAWVVAKYSTLPDTPLACGISFHPSWRVEDVSTGWGKAAKLGDLIRVPQLVLSAGDDPAFVKPGNSVDMSLQSKPFESKLREFSTMTHGWVNRGDLTIPEVAQGVREAWDDEALPFLKLHLG